ncbi:MAG: type II RES/Xre toxin-antitoxin system antitoxin [Terracidiphilus sp.]
MAATPQIFELIGLPPQSEFDLAKITENGISPDSLGVLKAKGLTFTEISEIIVSPRTLKHRRARQEPLSNEESDRVVRVARILALAEDVFASREKAFIWLRTADDRLDNRTPIKMLVTESGGRLVENMLWQIDEGIYS